MSQTKKELEEIYTLEEAIEALRAIKERLLNLDNGVNSAGEKQIFEAWKIAAGVLLN